MADMGTNEASKKWGYSQETIRKWCKEGLIEGASQDKKGSPWHASFAFNNSIETVISLSFCS